MLIQWLPLLIVAVIASTLAKNEPELPLCPTGIAFFPQNLPMHCRMPSAGPEVNSNNGPAPTMPPYPGPYFQSPPPNKGAPPLPFPMPPGVPFPPLPVPMPGSGPMPGPPPFPGGMPMPMPMPFPPMPLIGPSPPAQKLPVIVMPFYSPDKSYINKNQKNDWKRPSSSSGSDTDSGRNCKRGKCGSSSDRDTSSDTDTDTTDTDTSSDTDSSSEKGDDSDQGYWKQKRKRRGRQNRNHKRSGKPNGRRIMRSGRNHGRRRHNGRPKNLLTPIIQYVTNDGYVIFEKKISKSEAKDWLSEKHEEQREESDVEFYSDARKSNNELVYDDADDKNEETKPTERVTEETTTIQASNLRRHRPGRNLRSMMKQLEMSPTAMRQP